MSLKQCLVRCLLAQPESGLDETGGELLEQSLRWVIKTGEWWYAACQGATDLMQRLPGLPPFPYLRFLRGSEFRPFPSAHKHHP